MRFVQGGLFPVCETTNSDADSVMQNTYPRANVRLILLQIFANFDRQLF